MLVPLIFSLLASSVQAYPQTGGGYGGGYGGGDGYGGGNGGSSGPDSTPESGSDTSSQSSGSANSTSGATVNGDSACSTFVCVTAKVLDSNIEYTVTSANSDPVGWMGIGFGTAMINTPLVLVWETNGEVTLSQRSTTQYAMPQVDPNPPNVATLADTPFSTTDSGASSFTFTMPNDQETSLPLVWAYSPTAPSSGDVDATIVQHTGIGRFSLDLTNTLAADADSDSLPSASTSSGPLNSTQKYVIAHAILLVFGFMIVLPLGSLLARYFRTFTDSWFKGHRALQFFIGGVLITSGVALGVGAVSNAGGKHLSTEHRKWGVVIFALYWVQIGLGLFIHHVKLSITRPPQNYAHAVLGLIIIGMSFYQIRTGYRDEILLVGFAPLPNIVNVLWYIWAVAIPLLYLGGLVFLRKQYRQEKERRMAKANNDIKNPEAGHTNETTAFLNPYDQTHR